MRTPKHPKKGTQLHVGIKSYDIGAYMSLRRYSNKSLVMQLGKFLRVNSQFFNGFSIAGGHKNCGNLFHDYHLCRKLPCMSSLPIQNLPKHIFMKFASL
jgi:hypothetical protein